MLTTPGRLRIAAALLLTSPFSPLIFQGEEWGTASPFQFFTDHQDPGLARAVREGREREARRFGWTDELPDPQSPATFERSKLRWEELDDRSHAEMFGWYRRLITLRRELGRDRALADATESGARPVAAGWDEAGWAEAGWDEERGLLWYRIGPVRVLANLGRELSAFPAEAGEDDPPVALAPDGIAILRDQPPGGTSR